jgi:histidinol phosphatase-like enzyme (inositol monophosphatase family)
MTDAPPVRKEDLELALHMASEVSPLAMKWFSSVDLNVITKEDGSPVTQADLAVEQRLRELIAEYDGDAAILGEEEGVTAGTSGRRWILDPIDGTGAFAHGVPLWSTLIALHDEHGPAVGVVSLPGMNEIVAAGRGHGATLNGKPCHVSKHATLDNAFVTTWGYDPWPAGLLTAFQSKRANLRGWSDGYGWALLASGRVEVVVDPSTKLWDIAPMQTIIPEAGGKLHVVPGDSDIHFDFVIGTNGAVHDETVSVIVG